MPNSRHLQWAPLSLLRRRERKESLEDVIYGKVGGTTHEDTRQFLVWRMGRELTDDLDQRVRFACA